MVNHYQLAKEGSAKREGEKQVEGKFFEEGQLEEVGIGRSFQRQKSVLR